MRKEYSVIFYCIIFCLLMTDLEAREENMANHQYLQGIQGKSYTSGDYLSRFLHVTFLKKGYTLEKRPERHPEFLDGVAPPYEMDVRCYLMNDSKIVKMISSLNDFQGYVVIDSERKAIEFVRLLTSESTFFLFRPEIMIEVFKLHKNISGEGLIIGATSPDFFSKHHLKNMEVLSKDGHFEINRFLLYTPWPGSKEYPGVPKLFKVEEEVFLNGQYCMEKRLYLSRVDYKEIPYPLPPK